MNSQSHSQVEGIIVEMVVEIDGLGRKTGHKKACIPANLR